jgi:hypothetical protein
LPEVNPCPGWRSACPGSVIQARPGARATQRPSRARSNLNKRDHVAPLHRSQWTVPSVRSMLRARRRQQSLASRCEQQPPRRRRPLIG